MTAGPQVPAGGQPMPLTGMGRDSLLGLSDPATQEDLQQMRTLQVALVLQLDQTDASLRRLRWYVLTLAILILCLAIVLFVTTLRLLP